MACILLVWWSHKDFSCSTRQIVRWMQYLNWADDGDLYWLTFNLWEVMITHTKVFSHQHCFKKAWLGIPGLPEWCYTDSSFCNPRVCVEFIAPFFQFSWQYSQLLGEQQMFKAFGLLPQSIVNLWVSTFYLTHSLFHLLAVWLLTSYLNPALRYYFSFKMGLTEVPRTTGYCSDFMQ